MEKEKYGNPDSSNCCFPPSLKLLVATNANPDKYLLANINLDPRLASPWSRVAGYQIKILWLPIWLFMEPGLWKIEEFILFFIHQYSLKIYQT